MNAFQEEMCFTVSLYGTNLDPADVVPLVGEVDELVAAAGQPTTHLGVTARGFGKKPLRFDGAWKRLQKTAPEDLESVEMYSLVGDRVSTSNWTAICLVLSRRPYFGLGASLATMPDAEQQIVDFTRRRLDRLRPDYGIGFFRKRGDGPPFYGLGVAYSSNIYAPSSGPEHEESRAICRWLDGKREAVYKDGIQRDVYPYNLLTAVHLERDIDGRSLRDWIRADPSRGRLSECPGGYTLWTVASEDIPEVRRQLAPSGVLFVRRPENRH